VIDSPHPTRDYRATVLVALLLLAILAASFAVSVQRRSQWFGKAPLSMAGWMTGGSANVTRNWYHEGALKLWFVMYWRPDCIEAPVLGPREPYVSFPPGALIPVYTLSLLMHREPSPGIVQCWNLTEQFLVAAVLMFTAYVLLRRMGQGRGLAALFSVIPGQCYLWFPCPYYEHILSYFSDEAVMLPFVLTIFLEAVRVDATDRTRKRLAWLMAFVAFWGMFCDWFFFFVWFAVYLLRLSRGEMGKRPRAVIGRTVVFWLPALLVVLSLGLQIMHLGAFGMLWERFQLRTGFGPGIKGAKSMPTLSDGWVLGVFKSLFWPLHFRTGYGQIGFVLLELGGLAFAGTGVVAFAQRVRRVPSPAWSALWTISWLTLTPCFLYLWVFGPHSGYFLHYFAALKFAVPLALLPWAVLPAFLLRPVLPRTENDAPWRHATAAMTSALALGLGVWLLIGLAGPRAMQFPDRPMDYVEAGTFIAAHTGWQDVVFSPDFTVKEQPPQMLTYSRKLVHEGKNLAQIAALLKPLKGEYQVGLFVKDIKQNLADPALKTLMEKAGEKFVSGDMGLWKIRKADFEAVAAPAQGL
jgi:hypothetical protein